MEQEGPNPVVPVHPLLPTEPRRGCGHREGAEGAAGTIQPLSAPPKAPAAPRGRWHKDLLPQPLPSNRMDAAPPSHPASRAGNTQRTGLFLFNPPPPRSPPRHPALTAGTRYLGEPRGPAAARSGGAAGPELSSPPGTSCATETSCTGPGQRRAGATGANGGHWWPLVAIGAAGAAGGTGELWGRAGRAAGPRECWGPPRCRKDGDGLWGAIRAGRTRGWVLGATRPPLWDPPTPAAHRGGSLGSLGGPSHRIAPHAKRMLAPASPGK